jgi:signal peptidase I
MEPTPHTGELLLVARVPYVEVAGTPLEVLPSVSQGVLRYPFGGPRRGDVQVLHNPTDRSINLVKRLIGMPGETVLVELGRVCVDGTLLDEAFIHVNADYTYPAKGVPAQIPEELFRARG